MKYFFTLLIIGTISFSQELLSVKLNYTNNKVQVHLIFSTPLNEDSISQEKNSIQIKNIYPIKTIKRKINTDFIDNLYINSSQNKKDTLLLNIHSKKLININYTIQNNELYVQYTAMPKNQNFLTQNIIVFGILCFLLYLLWNIKKSIPKKKITTPLTHSYAIDSKTKILCINFNKKQYIVLKHHQGALLLDTLLAPEYE